MKIKTIVRVFFKIFFSWVIMLTILFFWIQNVNKNSYTRQMKYDLVDDKKIEEKSNYKIISKNKKEFIEKKNKEENKKEINSIYKREFLIYIVNNALNKQHYSPSKYWDISYQKLCHYYKNYCNIIDVENDFSEKEKIYFTAISIYLIKFLEKNFHNIDSKVYYIKLQKDKSWRRWYAWHHSIVMNIKKNMTYKQFLEVLTHEIGHIIDLWIIEWDSWFKDWTYTEFWKKSFAKNDKSLEFYKLSWNSEKIKNPYSYAKDFVSGYALTDPFEDFAETFNMYVNHNAVFIKMTKESNILKKKYNFINNIMNWNYLSSDRNFKYKKDFRPRDSTKMK